MPANVFFGAGMTDYIKSFREVLLTDEEFYRAFEAIYVSAEPDTRETRRRHVEGVRARVGRRK
jgi:hypothetical protein